MSFSFQVVDLISCLEWINKCFVDKRNLLPISREKVWSAYHEGLCENLTRMTAVTGRRLISSTISLQLMTQLIHNNYSFATCASSNAIDTELSERDRDIVHYISGYVLRKLFNSPIAHQLISTENHEASLVTTKNRGSLIYPTQELVEIVVQMEITFRQLPDTVVSRDIFCELIVKGNVSSNFLALLEEISGSSEEKDIFVIDFCNIFHTVRAHHKCRSLLEQHKQKKKGKGKSKALRDGLQLLGN